VVVKADGCEGFFPDGAPRTRTGDTNQMTTGAPEAASEQTIEQVSSFLTTAGGGKLASDACVGVRAIKFLGSESQLATRLVLNDWFLDVLAKASHKTAGLSRQGALGERVAQRLTQQLIRVWYDFDSLKTASSRPFKSFQRVQRAVESLTECLVNETAAFVSKRVADLQPTGEPAAEQEELEMALADYAELIRRLNI
jgi:hypothetical protein